MSDKSNKYGYVGVDIPDQSFGSNKGVFNPAEINELVADNKWTQYGQLELIETQTYSTDVASIDFTSIQESTYNVHFLTLDNFQTASDNVQEFQIQLYESGVLETASVYQSAFSGGLNGAQGGGVFTSASAVDGVNIFFSSGNIDSGTFTLYGLKK